MLSCIIVDDDPVFREVMTELVSRDNRLQLKNVYSNAIAASNMLSKSSVDLVFLDIEMPVVTGMDLIRSSKKLPQVIFITAHTKYAVEAFDYDVTDYLVKPAKEERLTKAVNKAIYFHSLKETELTTVKNDTYIKVGNGLVKINALDIDYIESYGDYVKIYTSTARHITLNTMNNIQNILPNEKFMRVHRKYIVQIDKITMVSDYNVWLQNNTKVTVSRSLKNELIKKMGK